jgi:hypothetical protein
MVSGQARNLCPNVTSRTTEDNQSEPRLATHYADAFDTNDVGAAVVGGALLFPSCFTMMNDEGDWGGTGLEPVGGLLRD